MFKKFTLKNGLKIINIPMKNSEAVTVLALVGTGSKYEEKEINGISHFLEHMFFKGTKKQPTHLEVAETLDRVGGVYNAFTGQDLTGYFAKVAAKDADLALEWVSDIFLNSVLPEEEIEKEKGVITEEINMTYDHPMEYVGNIWNKLLYGDQPAGWDIAGTKETVAAVNRKKLSDYMEKQYVASNTIVCIAGGVEDSTFVPKIEKSFSGISCEKSVKKQKVIEKQLKPEFLLHNKKTDQTHLCLGVRGYNLFHPKRYAQDVLARVLGGMMSSRLFIEIREKLGLAYYVRASADTDPDVGCLVAQAGIDNKNLEKAVVAILKEYKKIATEPVPELELKKAKDNIKGKLALSLESSDSNALFFSAQELLRKEILTPEEIYREIDGVSSGDVLEVARDIFRPENLNLALIGPFEDKEKIKKILKI